VRLAPGLKIYVCVPVLAPFLCIVSKDVPARSDGANYNMMICQN
jgi:hypothetical protein